MREREREGGKGEREEGEKGERESFLNLILKGIIVENKNNFSLSYAQNKFVCLET